MNLTTEFLPDRTLKQTTPGIVAPTTPTQIPIPGVQSSPYNPTGFLQGLDPDLIARLINDRGERNAPQPRYEAPQRAQYEERPRVQYVPEMAEAKPKEYESRWVIDPQTNPYHELQTGAKPQSVRERLINGKWEFEDLRPQGGSGGIRGGDWGSSGLNSSSAQGGEGPQNPYYSREEAQPGRPNTNLRPVSNPTGMGRR